MPPNPGPPIVKAWPFQEWKRIQSPCGWTTGTWLGPASPQVRQTLSLPSSAER